MRTYFWLYVSLILPIKLSEVLVWLLLYMNGLCVTEDQGKHSIGNMLHCNATAAAFGSHLGKKNIFDFRQKQRMNRMWLVAACVSVVAVKLCKTHAIK